jgi:hypothetical protein
MNLKKIPKYLLILLLTLGASLILGLLSFGGMFALWPILPFALAAFGLSVAYEGEIYLQNIKGAFNKLFKENYLKNYLANDYLATHLDDFDVAAADCPQFFKDYMAQAALLKQFGHKHLNKSSRKHKKRIEKTLRDMEKWFALQLFADNDENDLSDYERKLRKWLFDHAQTDYQRKYKERHRLFHAVKLFSALAAVFMTLGTTYLLMEAFAAIPLFAALSFTLWPMLIVPMAIVAGVAYGFLTYNSIVDMINNDTLRKWFNKLRKDLNQGLTIRNVFMVITAVLLVGLAVALTICTAGTWWTVARETPHLFTWMGRMPEFIMGIINPIVTGISAVVFNLENTAESLEIIDGALRQKESIFTQAWTAIKERFQGLQNEHWLQIINPARLLLKLTITPLRIILFIGHLISIGVVGDRVPSIPEIFSAILGIISEGFEDFHYFFASHQHRDDMSDKDFCKERLASAHGGHNHATDLPTLFLKLIFSPVYLLATLWDWGASQLSKKPLAFKESWQKQMGIHKEENIEIIVTETPSTSWQRRQAIFRIERYKQRHFSSLLTDNAANKKKEALSTLQEELRSDEPPSDIAKRLKSESKKEVYAQHRFFGHGKTATTSFIEDLAERVQEARTFEGA